MRRYSLATALLLLVQTDASFMIGSGCMSRSPKTMSSSMILLKLVRPFAAPPPRHASELVRTPNRSCYTCIAHLAQVLVATSFRPASSQSHATKASLETAVQMWVNDRATALSTYGPISGWVVSSITDMRYLFNGLATFDEDVSSWNTSSVTDMSRMFWVRSAHGRMP